jgi:polysaccharide pyruvyl transferase WcaK-like protein
MVGVLKNVECLVVIGADIMDGGYDRREAVARLDWLCLAARINREARLVSFSWSATPDPVAAQYLVRASHGGARLFPRDPVSMSRLARLGAQNLHVASDIVFSMSALSAVGGDAEDWVSARRKRFIILNVSGLIGLSEANVQAYCSIVDWARNRNLGILLLPHVLRPSDDDLEACRVVATARQHEEVFLVNRLLTPQQVAWVANRALAVITGRMHLGVISMNQGTPAAIFSTQGKVEGLMDLMGLPALTLDTKRDIGEEAVRALDTMLGDPEIERVLLSRLPTVRALARIPLK